MQQYFYHEPPPLGAAARVSNGARNRKIERWSYALNFN